MLADLKESLEIALQQDGKHRQYMISTLSGIGYRYVMLNCAGEEVILKFLPANRLVNENELLKCCKLF